MNLLANKDLHKKNKFFQKFILFYFFYILLEGAFRKWFLPNLANEIIIIRDLFVIFIIMKAITRQYYNFNSLLEKVLIYWTILVLFWIILQILFTDIEIFVFIIGLRNWVLYFWFSVLIFRVFNTFDEINNFINKIIYTIIPISLLVLVQHYLPIDHFLNKQIGSGIIFTVAKDIVRVTGTFSFTSGQAEYVSFITPFFLYLLFEKEKHEPFLIKIILLFSLLTCVAVSGSRGLIISTTMMVLIALIYNKNYKNFIVNLFIFLFILFICFFIYERAIEATVTRFTTAQDDIFYIRIIKSILPNVNALDNFNLIGQGIGLGSNMSANYTDLGRNFTLGEGEHNRIISEGGLLGVVFYISKFIVSIFFIKKSSKIYKEFNIALPLYFSIYVVIQLLLHPITGQITAHAFTFLSLGFLLSILNLYPSIKDNKNDKKKSNTLNF